MPTKEINAAILKLEEQQKHYEKLLDQSITNSEIFARTRVILRKLREVSQELYEIKKLQYKK